MSQLTIDMFGSEFVFDKKDVSKFADLKCGQFRRVDTVNSGGWFNKLGERLGWGDLDPTDFARIAQELEEGELFIILPERLIFLETPLLSVGTAFVCQHCTHVISRSAFYQVDHYLEPDSKTLVKIGGLEFTVLTPESVKVLITESLVSTLDPSIQT